VEAVEEHKMKSTTSLCGLLTSFVILSACSPRTGERDRDIRGEVTVPAECVSIFNFGYNAAQSKYFVACKKEDHGYSFYARDTGKNDWTETRFLTLAQGNNLSESERDINIPAGCNKIYNFGFNYAASKQFGLSKRRSRVFFLH